MHKRILILAFTVSLLFNYISAVEIDSCQKVTITGDPQWPPYVILNPAPDHDALMGLPTVNGIAIDIAEQIFAELDVAVDIITYNDQLSMMNAIYKGTVDLLVSTYKYDEVADATLLLEPPITIDPITIAVPKSLDGTILHWEDLAGKKGVIDESLFLDDQTQQYITTFLTVDRIGSLRQALEAVKIGKYDYVVGTNLQLAYELGMTDFSNDLAVQTGISRGGEVYMAYVKASPCNLYVTYLRKRLQDYQNNGTLDEVKKKYIK